MGEIKAHFAGAGQGRPLLLLHGGASNWREWRKSILPLSQRHRVLAPDLPGFGLTPNPRHDFSTDFFVNFLHRFMKAVGLDQFSIIGHSMGGNLAWRFALSFPQRVEKLILVAAASFGEGLRDLSLNLSLARRRSHGESSSGGG